MIDKLLIKKRFEKSLDTYDDNATVQNQMALKLLGLIKNTSTDFSKIFEFGIGSANFTKHLCEHLEFKKLYLNDIVKKSQSHAKKIISDFEFIEGDIEKIIFPKELDLITSNAAIQWVKDLDTLLEKAADSLSDGGILAFTTFGEKNFVQIQKTLNLGLDYLSLDELRAKLANRFEIITAEEEIQELIFESPKEVLKHMRNTGVNCLGTNSFYKSSLLKFDSEYKKQFSKTEGVVLTYHPIYIIAVKK